MVFTHIKTFINVSTKLPSLIGRLLPWAGRSKIKQIHSKRRTVLSPEKQAQLEELCRQLFKRKDLLMSGKFQFVGLNQIKNRMGKRWEGLSQIVYDTVEDVIDRHMDKGDIFIRYNDDSYIIIFAHASAEESQAKITLITEEIKRRLFELDEEELRNIEIRQAISEFSAESMMEAGFLGDMFGSMDNNWGDIDIDFPEDEDEVDEKEFLANVQRTEVGTQYRKSKDLQENQEDRQIPDLTYAYIPLWDTKRGALTTYLCLTSESQEEKNFFQGHYYLYHKRSLAGKLFLDEAILQVVASQLKKMLEGDKRFFLVCPVQHDTVYNTESYEKYKDLLAAIPVECRKFLLLFVMDMDDTRVQKNPYWFAKPLRTLCPHIFAEIPLRQDINFNYINNSGIDVAGVRLDKDRMTEQQVFALIKSFSGKAKAFKIPQTFIFDVSSLSITTSAICAGFDFLGGQAIHDPVEAPDNIYRYYHADLIKKLTKNQ